jgi:hypothetical protein
MTAGKDLQKVGDREERALTTAQPSRADYYARASRADRTWAQYRSAFGQFAKWCEARSLASMPSAMSTVREYIAWPTRCSGFGFYEFSPH